MIQIKNPLLRYLAAHLAIGASAAATAAIGLFVFDIGGVGTLAAAANARWLAGIALFCALVITWGSAAMGVAIFLLPKDEEIGGGLKNRFSRLQVPQNIAVPARAAHQRQSEFLRH